MRLQLCSKQLEFMIKPKLIHVQNCNKTVSHHRTVRPAWAGFCATACHCFRSWHSASGILVVHHGSMIMCAHIFDAGSQNSDQQMMAQLWSVRCHFFRNKAFLMFFMSMFTNNRDVYLSSKSDIDFAVVHQVSMMMPAPEPLYTEKHKVSCPGFPPKQSPCHIHAAMTMRFATSGSQPASLDAHGNTKR